MNYYLIVASNSTASSVSDINSLAKDTLGQKFTTSNFTETIVVNSESVFGGDTVRNSTNTTSVSVAKKRKVESVKLQQMNHIADDINKYIIYFFK